ncbi:hypothetical protein IE077_003932 [Cardiosporidium cionae]|uniref:Uncharacterized protein n=1 Tax=Cardiosporidium cionae TaxID=476202 RepID=A0ABQ7JEC4_9APIC|nr:hypothetical protein IE077_003932 [Cardiosporidium cionae]|eukprot:KAF8822354.1 hypothetical protein IE077_003932 [Cardiosporidium cionae]
MGSNYDEWRAIVLCGCFLLIAANYGHCLKQQLAKIQVQTFRPLPFHEETVSMNQRTPVTRPTATIQSDSTKKIVVSLQWLGNLEKRLRGRNYPAVPHPLRMQRWKLIMKIGWKRTRKELYIDFFPDGTLITLDGRQGIWRFGKFGLLWDLPMSEEEYIAMGQNATTVLHFSSEVHWNVFGNSPHMYRGIVTRDRFKTSFLPANLFRPFVATFHALGVGEDTVDVSYTYRTPST